MCGDHYGSSSRCDENGQLLHMSAFVRTRVAKGVRCPTSATHQENTVNAIVQSTYGSPDVLEFKNIEKPVVGDHEVSVRVHAAGVHAVH